MRDDDLHPMGGSSPRVWGIHFGGGNLVEYVRFIPTRVGNTRSKTLSVPTKTVHPHACGEYILRIRFFNVTRGSSPRVWGIRLPQR